MILNGIDRPELWSDALRGKRVGLLTTASGLTNTFGRNVDALLAQGIHITALFGPEHGVQGAAAAGDEVSTSIDSRTGIPVYSIYCKDTKRFTAKMLADIDVVVYDIADVGARFYTFISTLQYTVEDCACYDKSLVVLDRINPLGGSCVEGGALQSDCHSFVGDYPMPIRYGLTAGEFATMVNTEQGFGCKLTVIEVSGWNRNQMHHETGLAWIPPSPALQHYENAVFYAGTCLVEGCNVSEGRGTPDPFALIGAPYIDGEKLATIMNLKALTGVAFIPVAFTPTASKYKGIPCFGVRILLLDPVACRSVQVGLTLIEVIRTLWPDDFAFLPNSAEFSLPMIDLLSGNHRMREGQTSQQYLAEAQVYCNTFLERSLPYYRY